MNDYLIVPTEREQLVLKQLTVEDAPSYFGAVDASREHLSQFGDETATKYPNLESVEESLKNPPDPSKLRFGIWDNDIFVGSINLKPDTEGTEIGYWLDSRHVGHGYATFALKTIAHYATQRFGKPHAWVTKGNDKSVAVMKRAGFVHTNTHDNKLIFELPVITKPV